MRGGVETLYPIDPQEEKLFEATLGESIAEINILFLENPVLGNYRRQVERLGNSNEAIHKGVAQLSEEEQKEILSEYSRIGKDPRYQAICIKFSNFSPEKSRMREWFRAQRIPAISTNITALGSDLGQYELTGATAPLGLMLFPEKQFMEVVSEADLKEQLLLYCQKNITSHDREVLTLMRELMLLHHRDTPTRLNLMKVLLNEPIPPKPRPRSY
ncbi:MAG TPA: hypothetical protein VJH96_01525 [Patescibacteria group bacterium]|nr:hypothetical protein [Patescibacteria group bacterium]